MLAAIERIGGKEWAEQARIEIDRWKATSCASREVTGNTLRPQSADDELEDITPALLLPGQFALPSRQPEAPPREHHKENE